MNFQKRSDEVETGGPVIAIQKRETGSALGLSGLRARGKRLEIFLVILLKVFTFLAGEYHIVATGSSVELCVQYIFWGDIWTYICTYVAQRGRSECRAGDEENFK